MGKEVPGPNESSRRWGYYRRHVEQGAARQGLTVEEYGVYKGDAGSAVKPINSAGGPLFLTILITLIMTVVAVLLVKLFVEAQSNPIGARLCSPLRLGFGSSQRHGPTTSRNAGLYVSQCRACTG
ncbi:hypothetical protein GCM10007170_12470 [Arthrobacter liuii]|uniref:Uncharacterized protein n=1 Tax=Arthrobacter liuii TaxID=1476996 RepID=A0ABQ2AMN7_9MICC|nr:hypothetical protein GCM10007170_12470 [Arthrobacter liuii]